MLLLHHPPACPTDHLAAQPDPTNHSCRFAEDPQIKLAISFALAQSTKLSVLEVGDVAGGDMAVGWQMMWQTGRAGYAVRRGRRLGLMYAPLLGGSRRAHNP